MKPIGYHGLIMAIISLWGGAYMMEVFPAGKHWASFPTFVTAFAGFMGGMYMFWGCVLDSNYPTK